jgi:alpha-N-arabinofuranosidase
MRARIVIVVLSVVCAHLLLTSSSGQGATITVDADTTVGPVNQLLFGNAQPFGHGDVLLRDDSAFLEPGALDIVSDLSPTILRFPGGIHADQYFWEDGVGPPDLRPEPRRGQNDTFGFRYGTAEHLVLCDAIGAEAFLTVNYPSGIVDDSLSFQAPLSQRVSRAQDWVEYCNAPNDGSNPNGGVDWAAQRALHGHPEPYGIRYWEIGNEIYSGTQSWQADVDVVEYAQDVVVFSEAMKAVDPSIQIGAVGVIKPHWRDINATLLQIAGGAIDFLKVHIHYPGSWNITCSPEDLYQACLASGHQAFVDLTGLRELIDQKAGPAMSIVAGENGLFCGVEYNYLTTSFLSGLHMADLLMLFVEQSSVLNVEFACGWLLSSWTDGGDIGFEWWPKRWYPRPEYLSHLMFREHFGDILVADSLECDTFSTVKVAAVDSSSEIPELSCIATLDSTGDRLYILVLNRRTDQDVTASIDLKDFSPEPSATAWSFYGPSVTAHNEDDPGTVSIQAAALTDISSPFDYTFPAHSLTSIELTRAEPEDPPLDIQNGDVIDIAAHSAVLVWETNRSADSRVEYGTMLNDLSNVVEHSALSILHEVTLEPLESDTKYYFCVTSRDGQGLQSPAWIDSFWTLDISSPQISQVDLEPIAERSARITWATDEPATSRVEYGVSPGEYSQIEEDSTLTQQHEMVLEDLLTESWYHVRVLACDAHGNESPPWEGTLWMPDVTSPDINELIVTAITESTATLSWITSEPADSRTDYQLIDQPFLSILDSTLCWEHLVTLEGLQPATSYIYRVSGADTAGNISQQQAGSFVTASPRSGSEEPSDNAPVPSEFVLWQNFPNPFNARTSLQYQIPRDAEVDVKIYNSLGQLVKTLLHERQMPGQYQLHWDGRDDRGREVASGIYLCYLHAGQFQRTCKMSLVR